MANKELHILLLSNEMNFKWDFINFYSQTFNNKCLIPCKLQIDGTDICLSGEYQVDKNKHMIDTKLTSYGATLHFMGSRYEELKKSKLRTILFEAGTIDAVICMLSTLHPIIHVVNGFEELLECVGPDILRKTFFIQNESSLSLAHINFIFSNVVCVPFAEESLFFYNFPMYKKLIARNFQLKHPFKLCDFTEAKKSFSRFLSNATANTSSSSNVEHKSITTRILQNELQRLFNLLCEIFVALKKNETELETTVTKKSTIAQYILQNSSCMVFCDNLECPRAYQVANDYLNIIPCFTHISEINLVNFNCHICQCSFINHRISDYTSNIIIIPVSDDSKPWLKSIYNVKTFQEAIVLVRRSLHFTLKFMASISLYGKALLNSAYDPYVNYIHRNSNRTWYCTANFYYSDKYKTLNNSSDKISNIFNCFNEIKNVTYLFSVVTNHFGKKKFFDLKERIWLTKNVLKKSNEQKQNLQENQVQEQNVNIKLTNSKSIEEGNLANIKLMHILKDTIKEFTEEMKNLRKICNLNKDGIENMSKEVARLKEEITYLRNETIHKINSG